MRDKLQLVFIIFVSLIFFNAWIISPVVASGDFWYYFPSMLHNLSIYPNAWYQFAGNGLGGQGTVYQNPAIVFSIALQFSSALGLEWALVAKTALYLPFVGISIFSSTFLLRKIFPKIHFWVSAPFIFIFNTYVLMLTGGGQILLALSYSLMPLVLYSFIKLINEKKSVPQNFIASGFLLFLQIVLDLRIAYVTIFSFFIYFIVKSFSDPGALIFIKRLIRVISVLILVLGMQAFWIVPTLFYGIDPIKELGSDYSALGIVEFLSFARLENTISLLHPYFPENIFGKVSFMKPEFILLGILAFSSLLFVNKEEKQTKTYILFFSLLALLASFLAKGSADPFGNLYLWAFSHIPGFQLFRDSFKWYIAISLSYSILITYVLNKLADLIQYRFNLQKKYSALLIFSLFFLYFLFLLRPALSPGLNGTFKSRSVPQEYMMLNNYLSTDRSFYRTLWIPSTMLFGHSTSDHPQVSGVNFFKDFSEEGPLKKLANSKDLLDDSSIKYVIVPMDTESQIYLTERKYDDKKYQKVVGKLNGITWLEKEKEFGKVVVYKTKDYKDHFWCECIAEIKYERVSPAKYTVNIQNATKGDRLVFSESFDEQWVAQNSDSKLTSTPFNSKFNSFILPEGSYELEVYYTPQDLVDLGVKISLATLGLMASIWVITLAIKHKK